MTLKKSLLIGIVGALTLPTMAQKMDLTSAIMEQRKKNPIKAKTFIDKANDKIESGATLKSKDLAKFWHYKGVIYLESYQTDSLVENLEIAEAAFKKDLSMDSPFDKNKSLYNLGVISNRYVNNAFKHSDNKEFKEASAQFEKVVAIAKSGFNKIDTNNLNNAAIMSMSAKDYPKVVELNRRLIELKPTNEAYHLNKLKAFSNLDDKDGYIKELELSKSQCTDCIGVIFEEVNYYINSGENDKLLASLNKAIESDPKNSTLQYIKGYSLAESNDLDGAKAAYGTAIELDSNNTDAYVNISGIYMKETNEIIDQMNDLGFSSADQAKHKKLKAQRKEVYKEALPFLERSLKLDPENKSIASALMTVYYELGDTDKWKEAKKTFDALKAK